MNTKELLSIYKENSHIKAIAESLEKKKQLRLKGIAGSFDAVLVSTIAVELNGIHLIILHDKEEAAYFHTDLSNFLDEDYILFPSSYKKPYHYEEIENANILQRAEVKILKNQLPILFLQKVLKTKKI